MKILESKKKPFDLEKTLITMNNIKDNKIVVSKQILSKLIKNFCT